MAKYMKRCPKCGSTEGFTFSMTVKYDYSGDWGDQLNNVEYAGYLEAIDTSIVYLPKTVKCSSCKKRIPYSIMGEKA
jgi:hypothetical protein